MAEHVSDEESAPLLGGGDSSNPPQASSFSARYKAALSSSRNINGLEKALMAFGIFFVILTALFLGLFAGEAGKNGKHHHEGPTKTVTTTQTSTSTFTLPPTVPTSTPPKTPSNNSQICLTPSCVTIASTFITGLDTTVDPCENFYLFSNGGWLRNNPIPEGQGFFGAAQDIGERNKRTILEVLNNPIDSSLSKSDKTNIEHLKTFYSSCLDEDLLDRQGLDPLLDVVKEILAAWRGESVGTGLVNQKDGEQEFGILPVKKGGRYDPASRKSRLTAAFMFLHSRQIPAIFTVFPEGDIAVDPSSLVLWLQQDGLGLPSKDYYTDNSTIEVYTEIVRASLKSVYEELGEGVETDTTALADEVVAFEQALAKISLDPEDLDDPAGTYNPQNASSLQYLFPIISFADYFASYTPRPKYPDPVIVKSPRYLKKANALVNDLEEDVIEAYFVFRASQALGNLLGPKATVRKEVEWLDNFIGGIPEGVKPARGDVCLKSLLENYGFLIGRYYVQKAFGGDSKEYAEDIIVATIQAFKDRLPELDWLDKETREKAEEKASAITHKIGYPTNPNTEDPAALERYFSINLPIEKTDYFGNVLRSRLADQRRLWVQVGGKQDKGRWDMIPSEVNAYYSPPANEIAFPAGILQAPYFNKDWPEYLAFGAFGSVAGHELTHAFDQMGRQYDKDGKLADWWTSGTTARFEELKTCLLDQYANYTINDPDGTPVAIKSKFTNGEDMADGGGVAQSYRAWRDRFESDVQGHKFDNYLLPGLTLTREQLFFVAFAQGWARNIKPAEAVKRIRTDPHSPTNYRVIGTLSNDENFSKAFGCKVGSPMSNVNKCHVW